MFASVTACQSLLPDLLAPLRSAHPRVQISVRTGDAAAALALLDDGEADLAVAAMPSRVPATRSRAPSPVLRPGPSRPTGIRRTTPGPRRVVRTPQTGLVRDIANRWFRRHGITPRIAAEADGHEALLTLVALDYGTGSSLTSSSSTAASGTGSTSPRPRPASGELTIGASHPAHRSSPPLVAVAWAATVPGQPPRSEVPGQPPR
ncbi:LysR substrate-binding domain-containing protein [Streptomyces sp. KL116D]|uniref:LysR substrate-binding domain-containing protein n=1 Tax=Streptomyces sp. KL116D TaxID=3045152 RepID=UPI003556A802